MPPAASTIPHTGKRKYAGLFVGMATVDIIYRVDIPPRVNEKLNAYEQLIVPGGPATNAAVTFSVLGGSSTLAASVGAHPLGRLISAEMQRYHIRLLDLTPDRQEPPALSSIMIREATGERSVVSTNALQTRLDPSLLPEVLDTQAIILVDGNQMEASHQVCAQSRARGTPCVLDGGSWKAGTEKLLKQIDYAICSADFMPPDCRTQQDALNYLLDAGVRKIAITRGADPLIMVEDGTQDCLDVPQPPEIVDTLGAGDIFHGAFCFFILQTEGNFRAALQKAARVGSLSCRTFGTRNWIEEQALDEILSG